MMAFNPFAKAIGELESQDLSALREDLEQRVLSGDSESFGELGSWLTAHRPTGVDSDSLEEAIRVILSRLKGVTGRVAPVQNLRALLSKILRDLRADEMRRKCQRRSATLSP